MQRTAHLPVGPADASALPWVRQSASDLARRALVGAFALGLCLPGIAGALPQPRNVEKASVSGVAPEILLERLEPVVIESGNHYSENTQIRIRLVWPQQHSKAGRLFKGYSEPVQVEEANTEIYDGRNGATQLPMQLRLPEGETVITLKSLANYAALDLRNAPVPHITVTTGGRSAQLLIPQWVDVDADDKTDWLERRVEDLLARMRSSSVAEVRDVIGAVRSWQQLYKSGCGYFEVGPPDIVFVSAACLDWNGVNGHRLNADQLLSATVLHEARHAWVLRRPWWSWRRWWVWVTRLTSDHGPERAPSPLLGEDSRTLFVQDSRYAPEEADAENFANRYKSLFP